MRTLVAGGPAMKVSRDSIQILSASLLTLFEKIFL